MIQTSADVKVSTSGKIPGKAAILVGVSRVEDKASLSGEIDPLPEEMRGLASALVDELTATGKPGDVSTAVLDGTRLVLIGIGDPKNAADAARKLGASAARAAKRYKLNKVAILPPTAETTEALVTGFVLGAFEYREYRGKAGKSREADALGKVQLTVLNGDKNAAARGEAIANGQNYARTIASRPGNDINPPSLADEAKRLCSTYDALTLRVLDDRELKKLGMNGLLAVGAGSGTPPRLIAIEYGLKPAAKGKKKGAKRSAKGAKRSNTGADDLFLIVGKAITFDTGGLSLKPPASMPSMIFDKCGGMAVLGAMAAIAELRPDRPVVGLLAAAENMPGPTAYRPGDILTMYNGVTVDVTNTDAEGRLVLADALSWGIETYQPSACVDLATLTGACVVALGNDRAGAFCNNDDFYGIIEKSSKTAGEQLWRLPLGDDYREMLKAPSADIFNSPGRQGGASTAAEFLHHFIPGNVDGSSEVPWCHLDIAGPASTDKDTPLYAKGATGFGVRTLVELITNGGK